MPLLVSIHAPWEGCDDNERAPRNVGREFQFTHPGKGATPYNIILQGCISVSIHAPWEGCDSSSLSSSSTALCFNSRTLGRVRLGINKPNTNLRKFQFTHPGKGATWYQDATTDDIVGFQFTHPGKGATILIFNNPFHNKSFNSRTLGRVRPTGGGEVSPSSRVSIHAPWEGCDVRALYLLLYDDEFQFTHPGKGAT